MWGPSPGLDCNEQLAARVELDARAVSVARGDRRDQNAAICVDHAMLLPAAEVGFNDLRSRPDHLHRAPFQQQTASAEIGDLAKVVGHEDDRGTACDDGMHAL